MGGAARGQIFEAIEVVGGERGLRVEEERVSTAPQEGRDEGLGLDPRALYAGITEAVGGGGDGVRGSGLGVS
jgi:hypothetical protein